MWCYIEYGGVYSGGYDNYILVGGYIEWRGIKLSGRYYISKEGCYIACLDLI